MGSQISSSLRVGIACAITIGCVLAATTSPAQTKSAAASAAPVANFTDVAEKAGLMAPNVFGGIDTKKYIIETTGNGVAIFDYDNDGWPDIFMVHGTNQEGLPDAKDH